jgi:hypothetical protein
MEGEGNCCEKKSFGDDGANNSPANTIKSLFWMPSSWHFVTIFKLSMFTKHNGFKNPLHAAAENVQFVRGLEPPCYLFFHSFFAVLSARSGCTTIHKDEGQWENLRHPQLS